MSWAEAVAEAIRQPGSVSWSVIKAAAKAIMDAANSGK